MKGITRAELGQLLQMEPPHELIDFSYEDPCYEILCNLIEQGRAICRTELSGDEEAESYYITEQGRAALDLWRKVGDAVIT